MSTEGFDVKSGPNLEPSEFELEFDRFFHNVLPHVDQNQASRLVRKIDSMGLVPRDDAEVAYGANYDITIEIQGLIDSVRAMRNSVMDDRGRMREGITPREMKEVVTSTTSLMNLLMKSHEKLMSFERARALEQATVDILRDLGGEEIVSQFVEMMEARLEKD